MGKMQAFCGARLLALISGGGFPANGLNGVYAHFCTAFTGGLRMPGRVAA